MVKRNPDDYDERILWSLEGRKVRTDVEPTVCDGIAADDI